jgi:hypothetical protein
MVRGGFRLCSWSVSASQFSDMSFFTSWILVVLPSSWYLLVPKQWIWSRALCTMQSYSDKSDQLYHFTSTVPNITSPHRRLSEYLLISNPTSRLAQGVDFYFFALFVASDATNALVRAQIAGSERGSTCMMCDTTSHFRMEWDMLRWVEGRIEMEC